MDVSLMAKTNELGEESRGLKTLCVDAPVGALTVSGRSLSHVQ